MGAYTQGRPPMMGPPAGPSHAGTMARHGHPVVPTSQHPSFGYAPSVAILPGAGYHAAQVRPSASVSAEISVRSPRKLFVFVI